MKIARKPIDLLTDPAALRGTLQAARSLQEMQVRFVIGGTITTAPVRYGPGSAVVEIAASFLDPETVIWRNAVRAAGGTFGANSIRTADGLIRAIKQAGISAKVKYVLPLLGTNLAAARVPLRDSLSIGIATNVSFADGDFSESTGLQGDGTSKRLDLVIKVSDVNSGAIGLGYWENNWSVAAVANNAIGSYISDGNAKCLIQVYNGGAYYYGTTSTAGQSADRYVTASTASRNGHYYGQSSGASAAALYFNGTVIDDVPASLSPATASELEIGLMGTNYGAGAFYHPGRCACAYITDGTLTATEVSQLHTLLNTYLITPTGR